MTTAAYLAQSRAALVTAVEDPDFARTIEEMVTAIRMVYLVRGRVLIAGNGGSAAQAQHIAAELVGRFRRVRAPLAAIALATDTAVLTAIGNDFGYDDIFERQVEAIGRPGDLLWAISTSGRSANVRRAITAARRLRMMVIGFTGSTGGEMALHCNLILKVPAAETSVIQELHLIAAHAICARVEEGLF